MLTPRDLLGPNALQAGGVPEGHPALASFVDTWLAEYVGVSLSRRDFIVGLAATGVLAGCQATKADEPTNFADLEDRYQALIGVYAVDLESSATVEHRADERFAMCSTFKAYAAARILQMATAGKANLDAMVPITAGDIVVNSPVLIGFTQGAALLIVMSQLPALLGFTGRPIARVLDGPPPDGWVTPLGNSIPTAANGSGVAKAGTVRA